MISVVDFEIFILNFKLKVASSNSSSHPEILSVLWQGRKTFRLIRGLAYDDSHPDSYRHTPRTMLWPPEKTIRLFLFNESYCTKWSMESIVGTIQAQKLRLSVFPVSTQNLSPRL